MREDYQMTPEEYVGALEEQKPHWLRIVEAQQLAFCWVGDQIRTLGLTDTESIYQQAIVPLIEEQGCGWVLLEQVVEHFCRDWSADRIQAVVAPVRVKQELEIAKEQAEWEFLMRRIPIVNFLEVEA